MSVLCASALLAAGCSTSIPRVAQFRDGLGPSAGLSSSSEMIFAPEATQAELAGLHADETPEFSRSDARLGSLPPGPQLATSQWPSPQPPSIERYRIIFLPRSASSTLIFLPQREHFNHREFNSGGTWR